MGATLTDSDIALFLGKNLGHLATLMPDGSPHVAPVWIDYVDGFIVVNTAEGRVKTENMRRDPRVAISVHDQENIYRMVAVRGRVVEMTHDGADEHIDKMGKKYTGNDRYGQYEPKRVLVRIAPEQIGRMG